MLLLQVYVFFRAAFVGYMVISRVPPLLHTPLMAATKPCNMLFGDAKSSLTGLIGEIKNV